MSDPTPRAAHQVTTRARVVDVAARLLQAEGPAAVTTRAVAQAAGIQAPTIYRLFGDKDGLLDAVAEHVMATYVSTKAAVAESAASADTDPIDDLRTGWDMQIDFGMSNPTLFTLLSSPERGMHSPAADLGKEVLRSRVRRIAATGRLRVSEDRAIGLIHAAGTGTVLALLSTPPAERDPGLSGAMYEAVLRAILTDAPATTDGGTTAAAVALRTLLPQSPTLTGAEQRLMREWLDRIVDAADT